MFANESTRATVYEKKTFIDIYCEKDEACLAAMAHEQHVVEIRRKDGGVKMFSFPNREYYEDYDFGYWKDARIIWTNAVW